MQIKAVAFDFGGVIETGGESPIRMAAQMLGVPVEEFLKVYFTYNHLSNVGNLPWEEMFMQVVSHFDNRPEIVKKARDAHRAIRSQRTINRELLAMFPMMRRQGLKVAILSNATSELRERLRQEGILDLVDEVVVSGEIGFQKPHKEAFEALFSILQVQPHEVAFVDDSTKSLEKSGEIGYVPILFTNNEQLRIDLRELGIRV